MAVVDFQHFHVDDVWRLVCGSHNLGEYKKFLDSREIREKDLREKFARGICERNLREKFAREICERSDKDLHILDLSTNTDYKVHT